MKLERDLPADLHIWQVVDRLDCPALLIDAAGRVLHSNAACTAWTVAGRSPLYGDNLLPMLDALTQIPLQSFLSDSPPKPSHLLVSGDLSASMVLTRIPSNTSGETYFLGIALPLSRLDDKVSRTEWIKTLESTGHGIWDHNHETGVSFCSDTWFHLRGLAAHADTPLGRDAWFARLHPDDKPVIKAKLKEVDVGLTNDISYEFREKHEDGHWVWLLSRGRVLSRFPDGRPMRVIGNDIDITQFKDQSEQVGTLTKRLDLAVGVAGIGVWEYDFTTDCETWNDEMYRIYRIRPEDVGPDDHLWENLLHEDDRDHAIAVADRCNRLNEDFVLDYRIRTRTGDVRHIRSRATHYTDKFGNRKLIGVNWDITSDIEAAAKLQRANLLAQQQNAALEKARAQMEHDALHDALTGLANRRKLDEYQRSIAPDSCPAVLHIDLDRFKEINDTLGHQAGDQVLKHAAEILTKAAPDGAMVARVGGDEFVIFMENALPNDKLAALADSIIASAKQPYNYHGTDCRFGMSVGIATNHLGPFTGSELFANADLALYLAKEEGRGRCRFYTADLKIAAQAKKECADDILASLETGAFFCMYQPQFDARTLDLTGVEALVRWQHPSGAVWSPDKFLPTAQQLDVVSRIDRLVLLQTIGDMQAWQKAGLKVPRMSVNVSSGRLADPQLYEDLKLMRSAPGEFAFELLESIFLDTHDEQLAANLRQIRDHDIDIEIDDFGTGHASIVGMLNLKPARIKIDRQLVMPVDTSESQRQLVKSIIEIGRVQGIAVLAEGVESQTHIEVLQSLGCDFLQGYGLASPMKADQLRALLDAAQSHGRYTPFLTGPSR